MLALVALVESGEPKFSVVLDEDANASATNAAKVLVEWTHQKTGVKLPMSGTTPAGEAPTVRFIEGGEGFKYDGFRVEVSKDAVTIYGREGRAFENAVYYILNRYAGIDWFHPDSGADFEKSDSWGIPEGTLVKTPLRERDGIIPGNPPYRDAAEREAHREKVRLWNRRNGIGNSSRNMGGHALGEWVLWTPIAEKELEAEIERCRQDGVWQTLFNVEKQPPKMSELVRAYAKWHLLVQKHPDWFALKDGERVACSQALIGQGKYGYKGKSAFPCLTSPPLREQLVKNFDVWRHALWYGNYKKVNFCLIGDDQPVFCECERCRKLQKKDANGFWDMSDYWWDFVNAVVPKVLDNDPSVFIDVYAYQNYRNVPEKVKIVPHDRMSVVCCTHYRCQLHPLDSATCKRNGEVKKWLDAWSASGVPIKTFEYHGQIAGMCGYYFYERTWAQDLKYYHKINACHACGGLLGPWEGHFCKPDDHEYRYFDAYGAKSRWFMGYMGAHFSWDPEDDITEVQKRMLLKYYRSAGKEMLAYHRYLEKKLWDVQMCMPYEDTEAGAHQLFCQAVSGRPGVCEEGRRLLDAAKRAAKNDPKALERIAWDEKFFEKEWVECKDMLLTGTRERNQFQPHTDNEAGATFLASTWEAPPPVRTAVFSFEMKGKTKGFLQLPSNGKYRVPYEIDSPDEFKKLEFRLDAKYTGCTFLLKMDRKGEVRNFKCKWEL